MSKRQWQSAADFMAELQTNPEFQRQEAEREEKWRKRRAALDKEFRPILDDLRRAGVNSESIEEMTQRYAPLAPLIVQVLLSWLPRVQDDRVKESLIRSLGAAQESFDGRLLVESFILDSSGTLRWPIANAIAEARPFGISEWLIEAVQDRTLGNERQMLMIALARVVPAETSAPVLLSVLDDFPGHAAMALGEIGGASELRVLQNRVLSVHGWEKAEFIKSIRKIESRIQDAS